MVIGGDHQAAEKIRTNRDVVVDALPDDFNDLELFARVHSLVRLNTMREELDRRFETTAKFIAQPPLLNLPEITSSNARIVLVGSDSDFLGNSPMCCPRGRRQPALMSLIRPSRV